MVVKEFTGDNEKQIWKWMRVINTVVEADNSLSKYYLFRPKVFDYKHRN